IPMTSASRSSAASTTLSKSITSPPYSMLKVATFSSTRSSETEGGVDPDGDEVDEFPPVQATRATRVATRSTRAFIEGEHRGVPSAGVNRATCLNRVRGGGYGRDVNGTNATPARRR